MRKLRRQDDRVPVVDPVEHFPHAVAVAAEGDGGDLERSLRPLEDDQIAGAAADHGLLRHGERVAGDRDVERHVGVHARPQGEVGILELDRHGHRARLLVEVRVQVADEAGVGASGQVGELDARALADAHRLHLVLEDLDVDPDGRQVGHLVEVHAGLDVHPVERLVHLLDDDAGDGGEDRQRPARRPLPLQGRDLPVRDVPVAQPGPARRDERARPLGDRGVLRRLETRGVVDRLQVLHLGGDELRAVDVEQDLPFLHGLAEVVHGHVLDPAVVLRVDPGDLPVVVGQRAHGADGLGDVASRDGLAAHADALREAGVDAYRAGRQRLRAVRVHGDEVHAHRRAARAVRRERRVHRRTPVEDLPVVPGGRCVHRRGGGGRSGLAERRRELGRPGPAGGVDGDQHGGRDAEREADDADCDRAVHGVLPALGTRVPIARSRAVRAMRRSER